MEISAITGAVTAFNAMRQIASAMIDVRDSNKLAGLQAELLKEITNAQQALIISHERSMTYLEERDALKARVVTLEKKAAERERYVLHEIRAGAFVYKLARGVSVSRPAHYLCQPCYDKGIKAVLERMDLHLIGPVQVCPVCDRQISLGDVPPLPPLPVQRVV